MNIPDTPFEDFQKIPRLNRECVVTEKIDGTNASIYIIPVIGSDEVKFNVHAASRTKWIVPGDDNYGFAAWVEAHKDELTALGPGYHRGEWWGSGVNRGYGLAKGERRFSLFNTGRWNEATPPPACCGIVPVLYRGPFSTEKINQIVADLKTNGSVAAPGFKNPEGVVVFHVAANEMFKVTCEKDSEWKGKGA